MDKLDLSGSEVFGRDNQDRQPEFVQPFAESDFVGSSMRF